MKEQITEEYGIIGKNTKIIKSNEEGYGEKRLRNRRKKYINKEGNIPKMKGLPKKHKSEIGMRPMGHSMPSGLKRLTIMSPIFLKLLH